MGGNMFPILVTLGTLEILGMCVVWLSLLMIISIIVLVLFFFIITVLIITLRLSKPLQSNNLRESNGKLRKNNDERERERTPYITYYNLVGGFKHFFIFHNIWDNPFHWLIFFKMVKTTNQSCSEMGIFHCQVVGRYRSRHHPNWLSYFSEV